MNRYMMAPALLAVVALVMGCNQKGSAQKPLLSPSALCAELAGKQLVSDCKASVGSPLLTPTKEYTSSAMKFGDQIAYGFEFTEYENQEAAEKGILNYKQRYKELTGDDDVQVLLSARRPLVTFYAPINAEAAKEAADKVNRALTIIRAQ